MFSPCSSRFGFIMFFSFSFKKSIQRKTVANIRDITVLASNLDKHRPKKEKRKNITRPKTSISNKFASLNTHINISMNFKQLKICRKKGKKTKTKHNK